MQPRFLAVGRGGLYPKAVDVGGVGEGVDAPDAVVAVGAVEGPALDVEGEVEECRVPDVGGPGPVASQERPDDVLHDAAMGYEEDGVVLLRGVA